MKASNLIVHGSATALFAYTLYYELYLLRDETKFTREELARISRGKYLTFWNLIAQLGFNSLSLLNDILPKKKNPLNTFLDTFFGSCLLPLGFLVFLAFWPLYIFFPEGLIQASARGRIHFPDWFQHSLHSVYMLNIAYEFYFAKRNYPEFKTGLFLTTSGALSYLYKITNLEPKLPYPFLEEMSYEIRMGFFTGMFLLAIGIYSLTHFIHKRRSKGTKNKNSSKQEIKSSQKDNKTGKPCKKPVLFLSKIL